MDKKTEQDLRVTMMWLQRAVDDLYKKDLTKKKGDELPLDVDGVLSTVWDLANLELQIILILLSPNSLDPDSALASQLARLMERIRFIPMSYRQQVTQP